MDPKLRISVILAVTLYQFSYGLPKLESQSGQDWAVLVATPKGWDNLEYATEADICHAYQVLHRNGIPDSNIIVMMNDEVAYDENNPFPGVIRNSPDGPNVYKNVLKDYTRKDVTPENFLNVLSGNKEAMKGIGSGKVLESGPNDHIFLLFAGHGSFGYSMFPNKNLYANKLIKTLKTMHSEGRYQKMLIYWVTCHSGSMFNELLPENISILAETAANPYENAKVTMWDNQTLTYDGSEFNVAWLQDVETNKHQNTYENMTIHQQFVNVLKNVQDSHPQIYGDLPIENDFVKDYLGFSKYAGSDTFFPQKKSSITETVSETVSINDATLKILESLISNAKNEKERRDLISTRNNLLDKRSTIDTLFDKIVAHLLSTTSRTNMTHHFKSVKNYIPLKMETFPCYETLVENFTNTCVNSHENTYPLNHFWKLANLCSLNFSVDDVLNAFNSLCTDYHREMKNVN